MAQTLSYLEDFVGCDVCGTDWNTVPKQNPKFAIKDTLYFCSLECAAKWVKENGDDPDIKGMLGIKPNEQMIFLMY